ncbi:cbb3-type cytochrome c oxidase subunit 3 [Novosphingobium profundi]|uniref:cbb3-type cytochrome c oxidase subunit 3 n=1 Tax=Novosphingobium profundi TaxID=1774954 RepID=UPI001CFD649E|nr:cbb3-type cytochrome c oxidase subunit 3 [Novosphingobium profundi]MED5547676.1 cbb3-type cytochrome c oxidase subunit 3 [Pseudomonadota bacterium]
MNAHSTYETLRHIADSWGLLAMVLVFLVLVAWPFRPGHRAKNEEAATMIFKDENDG